MEKNNKLNEFIGNELNKEAKTLKANESIRSTALQALREKNEKKKKSILPIFFDYKVPFWMAAAAILILLLLLVPSTFNSDTENNGSNIQLAVHDTVYVDRIVTDTIEITQPSDTVVKTVYVKDNSSNQTNEASIQALTQQDLKSLKMKELEAIVMLNNLPAKIDFTIQPSGKSLSDDPLAKSVLSSVK